MISSHQEVASFGHRSTFHQYRNRSNAALQCGCNFYDAQNLPERRVGAYPRQTRSANGADNRDQNITGAHRFFHGFNEVDAGLNGIDIHENLIRRKVAT